MFNLNVLGGIHIDYNITTKEIICAGLKISDAVTCPIILSENKFAIMKMEDQTFIPFRNLECGVHIFIDMVL